MVVDLRVPAYAISKLITYYADVANNQNPFPLMSIDVDSYIVSGKIATSIDFHTVDGVLNLQIGRYCAMAEDIWFMIDLDKDYRQVFMGALSVFQGLNLVGKNNRKRKGQVIIQNDCWIANGVTIMGGVTVHNGAIVAARSVVTKDVPPYAIVAGNPARVIKHRFNEEQIDKPQRIAWWNWDRDKIREKAEIFHRDVDEFISEHMEEANRDLGNVPPLVQANVGVARYTYLSIPDLQEPYPVYEKVIREFADHFKGEDAQLLIYIEQDDRFEENRSKIIGIIERHSRHKSRITVLSEGVEDERSLFKAADYYITTRAKENVKRMCFADLYDTNCISGVDLPVFGLDNAR
jgi:virginiamycin A acetyltransferase